MSHLICHWCKETQPDDGTANCRICDSDKHTESVEIDEDTIEPSESEEE